MARVKVTIDNLMGVGRAQELSFDFARIVENPVGVSWWNTEETILTLIPYSKIHRVEIFKED